MHGKEVMDFWTKLKKLERIVIVFWKLCEESKTAGKIGLKLKHVRHKGAWVTII